MKFSTIFNILLLTFVATSSIQDANAEILGKRGIEKSISKQKKNNQVSRTLTITKTISKSVPTLVSTNNVIKLNDSKSFHNNIGDLTYVGDGSWKVTKDGLYSDAVGKGDSFVFTKKNGSNFVYSSDLVFKSKKGSASLIIRSNKNSSDNKEGYVATIDITKKTCKFFKWQKNEVLDLIDEKEIKMNKKRSFSLKVVAYDSWILFYVNDELMASTGDYIVQKDDKGQDTFIDNGVFGLMNNDSKVVFQNTYYKNLKGNFNPLLNDIEVTSTGKVEKKSPFVSTEPVRIQYVDYDASVIQINTNKVSSKAKIEIIDENGRKYKEGRDIPVKVGINNLIIKSTVNSSDGMSATVTYHLNVHRFKKDEIYYNEAYRDQYHFSVKEGWDNDPNGLVYFNGKYHLFFQFYDDIVWGPMHWAHATSTDLLHWENQPIALYPDANGAMFSGSIVADVNNTSGLFNDQEEGGLVAFIAVDGNGQRIKVAYSKDEGITWKKLDNIAIDWTEDPLQSVHFRDPKVFRWEGKWFMAIAGGPFRLYSSDNLIDWDLESTNADIYTECPDLYPIKASDGKIKWVLVGSKEFPGRKRFYKVGDFTKVDGKWTFVMDKDYEEDEGSTTFGKDSYATMTYYVQDFGTEANPTLPEILELNWMNSWEYSKILAETLHQDYAGTFSLNLKVGLIKEGDKYLLTESPIENYNKLRLNSKVQKWKNVKLTEDNTLLKDFKGELYEIIAKFHPSKRTKKIGFRLRTGSDEETLVYYDIENEKILIDRSKSGVILNEQFKDVDSMAMKLNEDGTLDMHIYVDRSSIELFTKDDTINAANQIFTKPTSLGASVLIEGEEATGDITIYPLKGIWNNENNIEDEVDESTERAEDAEDVEANLDDAEDSADDAEDVEANLEDAEDSADDN
uniref:Glycosyl hydrolase family 32 n=1 Tax=Anaeromyces contortus TaxID=2170304 RepID=A0A2S1TZB6_9FUNG|nr:Glycosyl hydrolase family 32 [Anaeromyces contortus]